MHNKSTKAEASQHPIADCKTTEQEISKALIDCIWQRYESLLIRYTTLMSQQKENAFQDGWHAKDKIWALTSEIERLRGKLTTAVEYLKEAKTQFAQHTTNSDVDDFIKKHS